MTKVPLKVGDRMRFHTLGWSVCASRHVEVNEEVVVVETFTPIALGASDIRLLHPSKGDISSGCSAYLHRLAQKIEEVDWSAWLPPAPTPKVREYYSRPEWVKDGQIYASCWAHNSKGETSARVWRVASRPGQPEGVEILAGTPKGYLPSGVFYNSAVLVADVGKDPTPPQELYFGKVLGAVKLPGSLSDDAMIALTSKNADHPIDWDAFLPEHVTVGRTPPGKRKVGQIYACRWSEDSEMARVWQITEEGDLVLAGCSKGSLYKQGGFKKTTKASFGALSYERAVLIFDSMAPSIVERASDVDNTYEEPGPSMSVAKALKIGKEMAQEAAGHGLRAKLEREAADAAGLPSCSGCGARCKVGKSGRCMTCWKVSQGATVVQPSSSRFVPAIDEHDLLPDAR